MRLRELQASGRQTTLAGGLPKTLSILSRSLSGLYETSILLLRSCYQSTITVIQDAVAMPETPALSMIPVSLPLLLCHYRSAAAIAPAAVFALAAAPALVPAPAQPPDHQIGLQTPSN